MSSALQTMRRWTYSDLVALPDDQLRHELIDGEHFVSPSPATAHQEISKRLFVALNTFVERHRLGEVLYAPFDIKLSAYTVLVPDLVFFTTARFADVVNEKHAVAAPDLVVEILSPGTRRRDLGRKRAVYDCDGAREYLDRGPGSPIDHRPAEAPFGCRAHRRHGARARRRRRARIAALPRPETPPARRLPLRPRPGPCPEIGVSTGTRYWNLTSSWFESSCQRSV